MNIFQNAINPTRNKEKWFPKDIYSPGLFMSHYSVNISSWLLENYRDVISFFIAICQESNDGFHMPKW